ncbi:MAG: DNA polymerase III subunit epsilon [Candidatus Competibacteraceae bacterium]|nr:DNA polymerase III subunit epsilon [Candidatus Competibacteraceae bacterium]
MRQIVLDTETTGLDPAKGHRIIEIGCLELCNRRLTSNRFHEYLQPDREIDPGAVAVHGITPEFLQDKPRFADIAERFLEFVKGAELVIHNAPFDLGFLDRELQLWNPEFGALRAHCAAVRDTLQLARQRHPGQRNALDALCKRYSIDNTHRTLHGALLDAQLLAEVYLAMTGGQVALRLDAEKVSDAPESKSIEFRRESREGLTVYRANAQEQAEHVRYLDVLDASSDGHCLWKQLDNGP